ncbi:hypothetical protein [Paenisporosarcina indica]|uniref:hypothetical protein n=1 Tax=Paenisporosarcina indica TaxID=650093 RepID=UPI001B80C76D|nr:hypothetical protein [Paenisporosarcina indica]
MINYIGWTLYSQNGNLCHLFMRRNRKGVRQTIEDDIENTIETINLYMVLVNNDQKMIRFYAKQDGIFTLVGSQGKRP